MTTPLKDRSGAKSYHIRNPIKRHGDNPSGEFVIIPNELARDTTLSHHAYRIAIVMRTHAEGFEVSAASIATAYGWGRTTVKEAIEELVEARWLVVRRYVNAAGNRVFDEYHLRNDRRFTDEEFTALSQSVTLQAAPGPCEGIPLSPDTSGGCSVGEHPPESQPGTKENQLEDQIEDQIENHPAECLLCSGRGRTSAGPCDVCSPLTETVGQPAQGTEGTAKCWACRTVGPEGCLIHTSSPVGREQLSGMRA